MHRGPSLPDGMAADGAVPRALATATLSLALLLGGVMPPPANAVSGGVADFVDIAGQDLSGKKFVKKDFSSCDARGVKLVGANLRGSRFFKADLSKADLSGADLTGASLENAKVRACKSIQPGQPLHACVIAQRDGSVNASRPSSSGEFISCSCRLTAAL